MREEKNGKESMVLTEEKCRERNLPRALVRRDRSIFEGAASAGRRSMESTIEMLG
jgi:hypothetical protein